MFLKRLWRFKGVSKMEEENLMFGWVFLHQRLQEQLGVIDFVWDERLGRYFVVRKQAKEPIFKEEEQKEND